MCFRTFKGFEKATSCLEMGIPRPMNLLSGSGEKGLKKGCEESRAGVGQYLEIRPSSTL